MNVSFSFYVSSNLFAQFYKRAVRAHVYVANRKTKVFCYFLRWFTEEEFAHDNFAVGFAQRIYFGKKQFSFLCT